MGDTPVPRAGHRPPALPRFDDANGGWRALSEAMRVGKLSGMTYYVVWRMQMMHFLRDHAARGGPIEVPVPDGRLVGEFENMKFTMLEG